METRPPDRAGHSVLITIPQKTRTDLCLMCERQRTHSGPLTRVFSNDPYAQVKHDQYGAFGEYAAHVYLGVDFPWDGAWDKRHDLTTVERHHMGAAKWPDSMVDVVTHIEVKATKSGNRRLIFDAECREFMADVAVLALIDDNGERVVVELAGWVSRDLFKARSEEWVSTHPDGNHGGTFRRRIMYKNDLWPMCDLPKNEVPQKR